MPTSARSALARAHAARPGRLSRQGVAPLGSVAPKVNPVARCAMPGVSAT
eukprot:CAMPEP_0176159152 /NCGR_PEP_ID=MMETSP0120_2-20121206/81412_1 /TAXON_ID=160619 /ORGANISM="Kryptoperidinium foliaceum, Strain CCMP 1326" /LENGTH=49 /DNA_ID= /DNA_START= /DNA_END= /DNA_ORIENTATION=